MSDPFLTPDFDTYLTDDRIVRAEIRDETTIEVEWTDGRIDHHHPWTLRENSVDPTTTAPITRERLTDIAAWGDEIAAESVTIDDGLTITWRPDGLVASYDRAWLRHLGGTDWRPDTVRPDPVPWEPSTDSPPSFDGAAFLRSDDTLERALRTLATHGLIRLQQLSTDAETVLEVAARIGVVRPTQFGPSFDVVNRADADSQAYTADRLGLHMDIPTRETPAGLQLLHCIENTAAGGESLMADGLAITEHLRATEPALFEALTTCSWVWANRSTTTDVRWSAPVVRLDSDGRFVEHRLVNILRLFPDMAHDQVDTAYRALRHFTRVADDPRFSISFPFEPGDCVIFDNRRMLHGREAFDPRSGDRHLRGCYVDHDDLWSRLRMLARAQRHHERWG